MMIVGLEFLGSQLEQAHYSAKAVLNEKGALFFPTSKQHSDQKADGISYEDDYRGNALATMLAPQRIEVRYHAAFSDERVARIIDQLAQQEGLECMRTWELLYQGRRIATQA